MKTFLKKFFYGITKVEDKEKIDFRDYETSFSFDPCVIGPKTKIRKEFLFFQKWRKKKLDDEI